MPKGDRQKLKADPADGTTPIANIILEAIAMAKLSGLQRGALIHLCRETYGWVIDGKRLKEKKITLKQWEYALDASKSRISIALKELEEKNIIHRRVADQWGGYYYSLNTDISKWNSHTLNIARLAEIVTVAHFGTIKDKAIVKEKQTVAQNDNSLPLNNGTVAQNETEQLPKTEPPTLYKEILKKVKEIYIVWNKQKIVVHKTLTQDTERAIRVALKDYSVEDTCQAIKNYAEILVGEQYFFKYRWTLKDFLKRGLAKFLDIGIARSNYSKGEASETHKPDAKKASTIKESLTKSLR